MKIFVEKKSEETKKHILEERKKLDTIVEGRCQAYSIEIERKILLRLNHVLDENAALKEDLSLKLDKARDD